MNIIKIILKKYIPIKIINLWNIYKYKKNNLKIQYKGIAASNIIYDLLNSNHPCMIARFGGFELDCIVEYLNFKKNKKILNIKFNEKIKYSMKNNTGVFPATDENLKLFSELMLSCIPNVDILGSWKSNEIYIKKMLKAKIIKLLDLEPYNHDIPWSRILKGKNVLVIHPFSESIKKQYLIRDKLFKNKDVLPEFHLETITAVQSIAGNDCGFNNWFEALESMKTKITSKEYDIAIIGCGAYGFPLASFVKDQGKKAIHLGGATQLLFGIKGRRWEEENKKYLSKFCYEYWIRPSEGEIPKNSINVENGCYW